MEFGFLAQEEAVELILPEVTQVVEIVIAMLEAEEVVLLI